MEESICDNVHIVIHYRHIHFRHQLSVCSPFRLGHFCFCRLTAHILEYIAHLGCFHLRRLSAIWLYWTSDKAVCVNMQHLPDSGPGLTGFCPVVSELARILTDVLGSLVNHSWHFATARLRLISILDLKSNKCPDANI